MGARSRNGAQETSVQVGPSGGQEQDRETRREEEGVWVEEVLVLWDACHAVVQVQVLEHSHFLSNAYGFSPFSDSLWLLNWSVTYSSHKLLSEQLAGQTNRVTTTLICAHNHSDIILFTPHRRKQLK